MVVVVLVPLGSGEQLAEVSVNSGVSLTTLTKNIVRDFMSTDAKCGHHKQVGNKEGIRKQKLQTLLLFLVFLQPNSFYTCYSLKMVHSRNNGKTRSHRDHLLCRLDISVF